VKLSSSEFVIAKFTVCSIVVINSCLISHKIAVAAVVQLLVRAHETTRLV